MSGQKLWQSVVLVMLRCALPIHSWAVSGLSESLCCWRTNVLLSLSYCHLSSLNGLLSTIAASFLESDPAVCEANYGFIPRPCLTPLSGHVQGIFIQNQLVMEHQNTAAENINNDPSEKY